MSKKKTDAKLEREAGEVLGDGKTLDTDDGGFSFRVNGLFLEIRKLKNEEVDTEEEAGK